MEAILGRAIYLDGGMGRGRRGGAASLRGRIAGSRPRVPLGPQVRLQELAARLFRRLPEVRPLDGLGPEHAKTFTARVRLDGRVCGWGEGRTKKG
ncbi:MAG: hypothetical protein R2716_06340 [Microthrixaceae bacterium]